MRFCMGWSEWVSEREGGEGRYWDGIFLSHIW